MTDWRTELQALVNAYDAHGGRWPQHHEDALMAAVEHARAALALYTHQPAPPAAGAVADLRGLADYFCGEGYSATWVNYLTHAANLIENQEGRIEQAYQYGRRDAEADAQQAAESAEDEPNGEVAELVRWLRTVGIEAFSSKRWCDQITRAADLLEQQQHLMVLSAKEVESLLEQRHPTPVPASERKPGPEDCDAEGRCWLHLPDMGTEPLWRLTDPSMRSRYHSHWLPATALPVPGQGEI